MSGHQPTALQQVNRAPFHAGPVCLPFGASSTLLSIKGVFSDCILAGGSGGLDKQSPESAGSVTMLVAQAPKITCISIKSVTKENNTHKARSAKLVSIWNTKFHLDDHTRLKKLNGGVSPGDGFGHANSVEPRPPTSSPAMR